MVTYYNRKDLVLFGNYLLALVQTNKKEASPDGTYSVSHADVENWKEEMKENKNHELNQ